MQSNRQLCRATFVKMESQFEAIFIYSWFNNQDHIPMGHADGIKWDINMVLYFMENYILFTR